MCVGERIRATLFEGWFKVGLYSIVSREKVAHEMEIIIFFSFIQLDRKIDSQTDFAVYGFLCRSIHQREA